MQPAFIATIKRTLHKATWLRCFHMPRHTRASTEDRTNIHTI